MIDQRLQAEVTSQPYPLLFVTISGAHLYGFPSADSDYDLRGVHILPPAAVLGLLCYLTATATIDSWTHGILTTSGSWEIPQALVWVVMPVGSLLMALEALRLAARNLRAAGHPSEAAASPPARAMGIE